jgi:starch synthase (maltosyl-transferring)
VRASPREPFTNWHPDSSVGIAGPEGSRVESDAPDRQAVQDEIHPDLSRRVIIENIAPSVNAGRFAIKRTTGESVEVRADVFADGHDVITVLLLDRHLPAQRRRPASGQPADQSARWRETAMVQAVPGTDEWTASFDVGSLGWHEYAVVGWSDRFQTWRRDLQLKAAAGHNVDLELLEGSMLLRETAARVPPDQEPSRVALIERADALSDDAPSEARVALARDEGIAAEMARYADRSRATWSMALPVWVDRERARFGAWYEIFPRSAGPDPNRSGTFAEASLLLPRIADLGFDVVYLAPIHPVGTTFRKGRNNSLVSEPGDPGSPWAIGSTAGGHTAIESGLGTMDDFALFQQAAERLGLEVALDLAWQCSPDHPWVREHPDWFRHRPDGTIQYAENPPKKYQDIFPLDLECEDWPALWRELLAVTRFWVEHGVRIFRVDNPHTKSFNFWDWLIDEVHAGTPDVVFLSEAFTRPKLMRRLAKIGFTQSYTYFTWRNTKAELTDYFTELTATDVREYLRPNLFANTPDILHAYLQDGGRAAFVARLVLAATLGANYGIYNGFELCEGRAVRPGSEEYLDSEKYQYRKRDWERFGNINEVVCRVNHIRREHRALQFDWTLRFHETDNDQILAYSKSAGERVLVVVNLDPHNTQHGMVNVTADEPSYPVHDLLDDSAYTWHNGWNYVRFDPEIRQAHILSLPSPADR